MFKRILVAIDGSATANRGLRAAMELAVDQRATVYAVHVVDSLGMISGLDGAYVPSAYIDSFANGLRDSGRKTLAKAETFARSCGVAYKPVLVESFGQSIADTIVDQARKLRADVIVLGTHGRRGVRRMLMGSDAESVLREANVPVLLVRNPQGRRAPRAVKAVRTPRRPAGTSAASPRTPLHAD
jgi:nucleotide-binding universal stress UspA family protein